MDLAPSFNAFPPPVGAVAFLSVVNDEILLPEEAPNAPAESLIAEVNSERAWAELIAVAEAAEPEELTL